MKIYTTLDPTLQDEGLKAISIVPAYVDYMNLGASAVQVEVGTGRILSMVQNRPFSIGRCPRQRPTTQVNYNVRRERRRRPFRGVDLQGLQPRQLAGAGTLRQRDPQRAHRHEEGRPLRRDDQNVVAGNNGNGRSATSRTTRATWERSTTSRATRSTRIPRDGGEDLGLLTNQVAMKMGVMTGAAAAGHDELRLQRARRPGRRPIDMAQAYASVAANGMLCPSKAIDKALDAQGKDITRRSPAAAMSEAVASTAAYTLEGVMSGTGSGARVGDGVPVFGKTVSTSTCTPGWTAPRRRSRPSSGSAT
jgi:hypothetical protein